MESDRITCLLKVKVLLLQSTFSPSKLLPDKPLRLTHMKDSMAFCSMCSVSIMSPRANCFGNLHLFRIYLFNHKQNKSLRVLLFNTNTVDISIIFKIVFLIHVI